MHSASSCSCWARYGEYLCVHRLSFVEHLGTVMIQISKKVWVGKVRIQQSLHPAYGGTVSCVSYPKVSSASSTTARMEESVESQILSLVKHHLTHKLLITLIETWHRLESVGRVNHWKWHIYIAPLSMYCGSSASAGSDS